MRLWHEALLPFLDNQRILGQHRECCALRGRGWGKKNMVVNYVFNHWKQSLEQYHYRVMQIMKMRGFVCNTKWNVKCIEYDGLVFKEHNDLYLVECLLNLERKGVHMIHDELHDIFVSVYQDHKYKIDMYRKCLTQKEIKITQKLFYNWEETDDNIGRI